MLSRQVRDKEENFRFWVPLEITKGKDAVTGKEKMGFKGIASTIEQDTDGETLMPDGFDLSYFLNNGFVNWNHKAKDNPAALIGEPTKAEIRPEGLYIETELYNDSPLAVEVYKLGKLLSKKNGNRKLGFSIEGKATERDPANKKIVRKARITGVAITPTPKNPATFADIIKGDFHNNDKIEYELEKGETYFIDMVNEDGDRITVDKDMNISIIKADENELVKSKKNKVIGQTTSGKDIYSHKKDYKNFTKLDHEEAADHHWDLVKKPGDHHFNMTDYHTRLANKEDGDEEKALSTSPGSGKALIREDLEGSQKNITDTNKEDEKDSTFSSKLLNKSEVYDIIFDHTDDLEKADLLYSLIYRLQYKDMKKRTVPANKVEINQDTITKALASLGLTVDGNDLEKADDQDEDDDNDEEDVEEEVKEEKKAAGKKGQSNQVSAKKMELKKALDEHEKKGMELKKALEQCDAPPTKNMEGADKNGGNGLEKGEMIEILGKATEPLQAQIKALGKIAAAQQQTIAKLYEKLEKGSDNEELVEKIDELSKAIEEIGNQSQGRKSLTNTRHLEKGFGNEFAGGKLIEVDGQKTMSVSKQKRAILDIYDEKIDYNNISKGEEKLFGDDMAKLEAAGVMSQEASIRFKKRTGIQLVP